MSFEEYAKKQAEKLKANPNDETAQKILEDLHSIRTKKGESLTNGQRKKILDLIIKILWNEALGIKDIYSEKFHDKCLGFKTTGVICESSNDALMALLKAVETSEKEEKNER